MSQFDDLPIKHVFPNGTPSDAELAADRDAKYQALLAHEAARGCGCTWPCACDEWPVGEVTA